MTPREASLPPSFPLARPQKIGYPFPRSHHGGYGEMVITAVCGTASTGSIPVSHPTKNPPGYGRVFGASGWSRTTDLGLRSPLLYPTELPRRAWSKDR